MPSRRRTPVVGSLILLVPFVAMLAVPVPAQTPESWIAPTSAVESAGGGAEERTGRPEPWRVGTALEVDLSPEDWGVWQERDPDGQLWRLRVRSPGALWLVLGFSTFNLKAGAVLRVHTPEQVDVLGPFGSGDGDSAGGLWLSPVAGDTVHLELYWPESLRETMPALRLDRVAHGFRDWGGGRQDRTVEPESATVKTATVGTSGWCNVDIACPPGDDWRDASRGVVQLLIAGAYSCTGSLVGNTGDDCRPYVLTANHCLSTAAEAAATTVLFGFERADCDSSTVHPGLSLTGTSLVATSEASDFTLLVLDEQPTLETDAFFNGWNRSTDPASEAWTIHHPKADVKKISYNADPLVPGSDPELWRVTEWEVGTTELGSSGAPLFGPDGLVVGQLSRGVASCDYPSAYDEYGRLDVAWSGGGTPGSRLSDWLDPLESGSTELSGLDLWACLEPQPRLRFAGHAVDDSAGDGDGAAEPGETFLVVVSAHNEGTSPGTEVSGSLVTTLPSVEIVDGQASWNDLAPGETSPSLEPHYSIALAPEFPCGGRVELRLDWVAREGAWSASFELVAGSRLTAAVFEDDVESGPGAWTNDDAYANNPWFVTTADSSSPTHSWFVADPGMISDSRLVSGPLPVTGRGVLGFAHSMDSENGFDGGVLEYSLDGGGWQDAGPIITAGDYTERVSYGYASPIAGRMAWSGFSGGWKSVRVDLAALEGSEVVFRWRFASDEVVGDVGWFVDDVYVEDVWHSCDGPAPCGSDADCDDGDDCTEDSCDVEAGSCSHVMPPLPDEVHGLTVEPVPADPSTVLLSWEVAGGAETYDLYMATTANLADLTCVQPGIDQTATTDDTPLGSSGLLAYLVTARNCAGESPLGYASSGVERRSTE